VQGHEVGDVFDPYSPQSIALAVNRLMDDPALCQRLRGNTVTALSNLDAESEWCRLVNLYDELPRALA